MHDSEGTFTLSPVSALPTSPDNLVFLLESIRRDKMPCLIDKMYQTAEQRAGYAKHMAFMDAGKNYRQRLFMAGNRVGKTEGAGGYELAMHLTGRYPSWWKGRMFYRPITAWAAGDTRETTRDILQKKIIGEKGKLLEGNAPEEILRYAEAGWPGVIVIASHGRTGLRRLLMGGVVEWIVANSTMPVWISKS